MRALAPLTTDERLLKPRKFMGAELQRKREELSEKELEKYASKKKS